MAYVSMQLVGLVPVSLEEPEGKGANQSDSDDGANGDACNRANLGALGALIAGSHG